MFVLRAALVLSAALGIALGAVPAQAQPGPGEAPALRVLVPDPDSPFLAPAVRVALGKQLRARALRHTGLEVVPLDAPGLTALRQQAGCDDAGADCLLALARAARADRVFFSQVQRLPGRFLVHCVHADAGEGKLLGELRQRVKADPKALGPALLKGWGELVGVLVKTQLKLSADVEGAEVFVDGRRVGATPLVLTRELEAGSHELRVSKAGLGDLRRRFEVSPKQAKVVLRVALRSAADEPLVGEKLKDDDGIPVVPLSSPGGAAEPAGAPVPVAEPPPVVAEPPPVVVEPPPVVAEPPPVVAEPGSLALQPRPVAVEALPGAVPPSGEDEGGAEAAAPVYEKWWFWTALGAVVVAGAVTGLALGLSQDEGGGGIPDGLGRVNVSF